MILSTEHDAIELRRVCKQLKCRVVVISSMDVYRAYGGLLRIEQTVPATVPLSETSPLRETLYPYRGKAKSPDDPAYHYDKIPVERLIMGDADLAATVL